MTSNFEKKLHGLGLELPNPAPAAATYAPFINIRNVVFVSGQLPFWNGELRFLGAVGRELTLEEGQMAAQLCALNLLAQLKAACEGNLDRVRRCIRLGGFVNSEVNFKDHPKVINGASELMIKLLGENGQHARAAIGVSSLPLGVSVEVEGMFEIV